MLWMGDRLRIVWTALVYAVLSSIVGAAPGDAPSRRGGRVRYVRGQDAGHVDAVADAIAPTRCPSDDSDAVGSSEQHGAGTHRLRRTRPGRLRADRDAAQPDPQAGRRPGRCDLSRSFQAGLYPNPTVGYVQEQIGTLGSDAHGPGITTRGRRRLANSWVASSSRRSSPGASSGSAAPSSLRKPTPPAGKPRRRRSAS